MSDGLTMTERAALLTLMAEARELPNSELTGRHRVDLKKPSREKLAKSGYLTVRTEKRRYYLELTDAGWAACRTEFGAPAPPRAGSAGGALYAVLAGILRHLERTGVSVPEAFARDEADDRTGGAAGAADEPAVGTAEAGRDLATEIRTRYAELAPRDGAWVKLADLRAKLVGAPRAEVDRALVALEQAADVSIVPESNQKSLTDVDRAASVRIGLQDKHLIAIGSA